MKNKIKNGLFLPQVIFTLFGFLTVVSCNKINYRVSYPTTDPNYQPYNGNQVLVWKAPDATTSDFRNDLDSILNRHPGYTAGFCSNCDNNLVIISGPAASQALGPVGQLATGGSGGRPSGPSGGGAGYYWGVNFIVTVNDPIDSSELNDKRLTAIKPTTFSESPVAVAVLDTGVDSAGLRRSGDLYIGTDSSCLNHFAQNGWNFPDNTPAVEDHYHPLQGHGSTVSRLILEEVQAIHKTPVKILPVKIISDHGSAKLFDVLCALAYAKDRGAKIINASFGYYSCK